MVTQSFDHYTPTPNEYDLRSMLKMASKTYIEKISVKTGKKITIFFFNFSLLKYAVFLRITHLHYSQFVLFQSTNLACKSKRSANANFSCGDARSYHLKKRSRTSQCAHRSESTCIHYAQFTNF